MSESASTFGCLPPELLERILLLLTPWEVLQLRTLSHGFRDLIDGSPMTQYRIEMFEAAVEEGFGQDRSLMNLADLRSQLEKYRSRWDHFDLATQEIIDIPPTEARIFEKGYLAYLFRTGSTDALCVRVIRLPSACNGVTRGEWVFNLETPFPAVGLLRMTLQPELDLLVVVASSDGDTVLRIYTLRLSDGISHPVIPTPEPIRAKPGFVFSVALPFVTGSRLACFFVYRGLIRTLRVYELRTGQIILDEPQCVFRINFIDECWLLVQGADPVGGFTLWDTTNPTAPNMWFLQDPVPPYPRILHKAYLEVSSGPGAAGVFRLDSSRRLVAILGRVVTEERRERHLTFVIPSSVLISLALGERRGATIEWEKWKGKVATLEQSSRFSIMWVEGSRVFILGEEGQEAGFTVYNFSPGARKGQKSPPYTSQRLAPAVPPPAWYRSWEVSGDTVVLIDAKPGLSTVVAWSI